MTKQRPLTIRKSGQQLRLTIPKDLGLEAGTEVGVLPYKEYLKILNNDIKTITKKLETTEKELIEANSNIEKMKKELTTIRLNVAEESKNNVEEIKALTLDNKRANEKILNLTKEIVNLEKEAKKTAEANNINTTKIATLKKEIEKLEAIDTEKSKLYNSSINSIKLLATDKIKTTAIITEEETTEAIKKQLKKVGLFSRLTGKYNIVNPKVSNKIVDSTVKEIENNSKFILPNIEETK